ncbi:unnamed protein product [Closterium sp. NIES-65]|nr:unnamed protein product [Closterium sp. NIES-65]
MPPSPALPVPRAVRLCHSSRPLASTAAVDYLRAEEVGAASAPSGRRRSGKGRGGRSGGGGRGGGGGGGSGGGGGGGGGEGSGGGGGGEGGGGGGGSGSGGGGSGGGGGGGSGGGGGGSGGGRGAGGSGPCPYVIRTGDRTGQTCGRPHTQHRYFYRPTDAFGADCRDAPKLPN